MNSVLRLNSEHFGSAVCCLGEQLIRIVEVLGEFEWYSADVDPNPSATLASANVARHLGATHALIAILETVGQLERGVFLAVRNSSTEPTIRTFVETEDDVASAAESSLVEVEIRAFDTTFFEIVGGKAILSVLSSQFPGSVVEDVTHEEPSNGMPEACRTFGHGEMSTKIDRIAPTRRPAGASAGAQHWLELSFLHWRVPADMLRPLLPSRLTIDECDGSAWVALVPFRMEGVRPWWSPSVPGISNFAETNVRTYVHYEGRDPGVWFFSLEAANRLAVWIARNFWHLNYQFAKMRVTRDADRIRYESTRRWPDSSGVGGHVEVTIGDPIEQTGVGGPGTAEPGTLEHFLAERYVLYAQHPRGHLLRGRVHHVPYPLRQATCESIEDTLVPAAGIDVGSRPPDHVLFSEGVNVNVFSLERV